MSLRVIRRDNGSHVAGTTAKWYLIVKRRLSTRVLPSKVYFILDALHPLNMILSYHLSDVLQVLAFHALDTWICLMGRKDMMMRSLMSFPLRCIGEHGIMPARQYSFRDGKFYHPVLPKYSFCLDVQKCITRVLSTIDVWC